MGLLVCFSRQKPDLPALEVCIRNLRVPVLEDVSVKVLGDADFEALCSSMRGEVVNLSYEMEMLFFCRRVAVTQPGFEAGCC